ncbi:MAG TPA: 2-dehydro-3-deoxygalactonokinase [Puia sp.]|nr:2-dehydro-3-deoxygalactonokinase [Puia sp.]
MERFFSCDWGTSSFRLKLVNAKDYSIIAEEKSDQGILRTFELWRETGSSNETRAAFYCRIIESNIKKLEEKLRISSKGLPVILSGMASSNLGICELPYKKLPFLLDGSDLNIELIAASEEFAHDLMIISGGRTEDDVMRGEETQLVGCSHSSGKKEFFIFPGTHSKHVVTGDGRAIDLKTYMTGEFFELLSKKSILSPSIENNRGEETENEIKSFEEGIESGVQSNILNSGFHIRVNSLLNKKSSAENYHYLSGLLIGTELKELVNKDLTGITIVGERGLSSRYEKAFQILNRFLKTPSPKIEDGETAVIKGQLIVYNCHR